MIQIFVLCVHSISGKHSSERACTIDDCYVMRGLYWNMCQKHYDTVFMKTDWYQIPQSRTAMQSAEFSRFENLSVFKFTSLTNLIKIQKFKFYCLKIQNNNTIFSFNVENLNFFICQNSFKKIRRSFTCHTFHVLCYNQTNYYFGYRPIIKLNSVLRFLHNYLELLLMKQCQFM